MQQHPLIRHLRASRPHGPSARPVPFWNLSVPVAGTYRVRVKARAAIRNYLKNLRSEEAVELGRRLLNQALAPESLTLDEVEKDRISALLEDLKLETLDELLEDIGLGQRPAALVTRRLIRVSDEAKTGVDPEVFGVGRKFFYPTYSWWETSRALETSAMHSASYATQRHTTTPVVVAAAGPRSGEFTGLMENERVGLLLREWMAPEEKP